MQEAADSAELVRRIAARAGEARAAEAELCRRFSPRAYLYGRRHLRNEAQAHDLAQTVMLAVIEAVRAGRVEDADRIDRFVLGTCRNTAHRIRDMDARAEATEAAELDALPSPPPPELADATALYHCMAGLDARDRTVVVLTFMEGRSAAQISDALQTSPGNVRVLRHRAVAQLRRCLDDCGERDPR